MSDNRNIRDERDRSRVAASQDHEVQYIAKALNASPEEVRKAIRSVGNRREDVEQYLRNNSGRYNQPRH